MLTALWQDEEIIVIDKPAGLATQPGAGIKISLVEAVERDFGFRPFLVHRLDKETAGCVIVARDARAAAKWTEMIASRELGKVYRAIVRGLPGNASGLLESDVRVRGEDKAARTRWKLVGGFWGQGEEVGASEEKADAPEERIGGPDGRRRFALLELELGTGRRHQIRLQLAAAGWPILGDEAHGDFALNKELRKAAGLRRLLLHASRLTLPGRAVVISPEPQHFADFLARFADAPAWEARP